MFPRVAAAKDSSTCKTAEKVREATHMRRPQNSVQQAGFAQAEALTGHYIIL
jgi:hypothetical protein